MKTNKWISITLAAAFSLGGFLTTPSLGAETAAPARGRYLNRLAQRLNLSDDQKAQIKSILQAEKDTLKDLRTQLRSSRESLRDTIQAANANESSVRIASAKVAAVEANLAVERMKIFARIAPLLTDEQLQELKDLENRADAFVNQAVSQTGENPAK